MYETEYDVVEDRVTITYEPVEDQHWQSMAGDLEAIDAFRPSADSNPDEYVFDGELDGEDATATVYNDRIELEIESTDVETVLDATQLLDADDKYVIEVPDQWVDAALPDDDPTLRDGIVGGRKR